MTFFISHVFNPIIVELFHVLFPKLSFDFPEGGLNERSLLNQYGGSIAALLIILKLYGMEAIRSIFRHSKIKTKTIPWLLVSVLLPLLMILLSYSLAGVQLGILLTILQEHFTFYLLIIISFVITAGLAEEFGWRGFLLPQLLKNAQPLTSTFIIFIIVSLWHFPALLASWKEEPLFPWLILSFSLAVIHSWLFFKSDGNLWVVILYHSCFDTQYSFYSNFILDEKVLNIPLHQGWAYVWLHSFLALAIIMATKGKLGFKNSELNLERYFALKKHERTIPALDHVV